jgi:hypothetical protein
VRASRGQCEGKQTASRRQVEGNLRASRRQGGQADVKEGKQRLSRRQAEGIFEGKQVSGGNVFRDSIRGTYPCFALVLEHIHASHSHVICY